MSRAYIVRVAESRELVGVFVAESRDELSVLVDEFCGPDGCEAATLPSGGFFFPDGAPLVADACPEDFELPSPSFSDHWDKRFFEPTAGWFPLSGETAFRALFERAA